MNSKFINYFCSITKQAMKQVILTAIILLAFSSCRKDRSCICSQNGTEVSRATYTHVKKSEANTYCQAVQNSYSAGSGVTCSVK